MQSICSADGRGLEGAKTELFPLPEGSSAARRGPRKKFSKSEGATKMTASSIDCIFIVSRDHLDEGRTMSPKVFKLRTFIKKAVFKIEVDRRLKSLHF